MATRTRIDTIRTLELPDEFEDLSGVIASDLKVIVNALTQRARERMLLTPGQTQELRRSLWNKLADIIVESMEPLRIGRN
jgi:hypothetical protein